MTEQTASQQASVAPTEGVLKRNIQMKMFATADDRNEVAFKKEIKVLGQLVGVIYDVKEKTGQLPNGDEKISLLAIGEFEGTNYTTGEIFQSTTAYLPGYFVEAAQSKLKQPGATAVEFAIEILLEPTGKSIPVAYAVRNLIKRTAGSPIDRMKAEMAKAGRLRLPPPEHAPEPEELNLSAESEMLQEDDASRQLRDVPPKDKAKAGVKETV